jgi:oxygen-independent coproporphyrinogen-3 oxidase
MIDFNKFTKYSKPGPRYTSYPTAVEFHENFTSKEYLNRLDNLDPNRALSLYVHLPFCKSACYFCGCNVIYTSKEDKKIKYMEYLKKELDILSSHLDTKKEVTQFHFGGGTPTFYNPSQLEEIIVLIKSYFPNFAHDAEISCEIDPRFFSDEHMAVMAKYGFNRISFGVQDFDDKVQLAIQRVQSFEETLNSMNIARKYGIKSINVDLIYGLPYQSLNSFKNTLDEVLKLDPTRLAVFNYAHVPWLMKTMRKIDETTLPEPKEKLEILKYTIDFFTHHGYKMVGMDHFAKEDDELFTAINKGELHRNFQGYTTKHGADLIGIGVTSIGNGKDYFAQNHKDIKLYEAALDKGELPIFKGYELSKDDIVRQDVIMELMSNFKIDIKRFEKEHNLNFFEYFPNVKSDLKEFEDDYLLSISDDFIEVGETGSMLIRNIAMVFDAYLQKIPEEKRRFSKTV